MEIMSVHHIKSKPKEIFSQTHQLNCYEVTFQSPLQNPADKKEKKLLQNESNL